MADGRHVRKLKERSIGCAEARVVFSAKERRLFAELAEAWTARLPQAREQLSEQAVDEVLSHIQQCASSDPIPAHDAVRNILNIGFAVGVTANTRAQKLLDQFVFDLSIMSRPFSLRIAERPQSR